MFKKSGVLLCLITAVMITGACATKPKAPVPTVPPPPPGPAVGCYDSSTVLDFIYTGPLASYKNAQAAISQEGQDCGAAPMNVHVTVVLADSAEDAIATCQAGPDPAANAATNPFAAGFETLDENVWFCTSPLSDALLVPGSCFPIGTSSVQFAGPRNTLDNAAFYTGTTCEGVPQLINTYVQHGSEAAALDTCVGIDPAFNKASSLNSIGGIPDDAYLCHTV